MDKCFLKKGVVFSGDALFLLKLVNFPNKILINFLSVSLVMLEIQFLVLELTGAHNAGPVFLPKNTFIEHGFRFPYWSFQFSIFSFHQRRSHSPIASMIGFQQSTHLVACSFYILIHYPDQIIDFQLSNFFFVPFRSLTHCGKDSVFHLLQIISAYACDILNTVRRTVYR